MNLSRSFNMLLWKSGQVVITKYNVLRVTDNYIRYNVLLIITLDLET